MMAVTHPSAYNSSPQHLPNSGHFNFINSTFVHSNPPKPLMSSSSSQSSTQNTAIRNWVKNGDVDKLENLVLEGQGARLLGLMDSTSDTKVKAFLRSIPGQMAKVDLIHDAAIRGSVRELQNLVDKKKLSLARDAVGRGLAHKAVLHSQKNVLDWLGKKHPEALQIRDNESRTCLHYSGISKNPPDMYNSLLNLGANPEVVDIHGRKASYYLTNPQELYIEGMNGTRKFNKQTSNKFNRRRISPISPKSCTTPKPPHHLLQSLIPSWTPTPQITRAQIRIWIHEKDISKLEKIVWSGNGDKLLLETTNNPKVRKFLDNVPYLLHHIKLIHTAAIHNDVEGLKEIRSRIESSTGIPGGSGVGVNSPSSHLGQSIVPELFTARDAYGLSPMHKATGLNNRSATEYLLYEFTTSSNLQDNFKRAPLHYAAARTQSEAQASTPESLYNFLLRTGADESILDYKHREASYYLSHPGECDSFKFLRNIPDAPRVLSSDKVLIGWDRSGVLGIGWGVSNIARNIRTSPQPGKRKISSSGDEFGESTNEHARSDSFDDPAVVKPSSKVARTEELVDQAPPDDYDIVDVGDGYVADSDEGKYELNDDVEITGEVEEEFEYDDEVMKRSSARMPSGSNQEEYEQPASPVPTPEEAEALQESEQLDTTAETKTPALAPDPEPEPEPEEDGKPMELEYFDAGQPTAPSESPLASPQHRPATSEPPQEQEPEAELAPPPAASRAGSRAASNMGSPSRKQSAPPPSSPPPNYYDSVTQPADPKPADVDVDALIASGDMESLVNLVLKGQGHDLTSKSSENPEIQEFLTNVPAYMAKINSIHNAAYTGNMRELQSLLDRKRLAEAQDTLGRGPLHHAVLGNNSQVVRYLVNGYPQCVNLRDSSSRTALHYAATLQDSGAMYKVLIQAGADPNIKDGDGNTPGIYLRRKDLLKIEDLMKPRSVGRTRAVMQQDNSDRSVDSWERPPTPYPEKPPSAANQANTNVVVIQPSRSSTPNYDEDDEDDSVPEVPVSNLSLLNSFYLEVLGKDSQSIWSRTWKKLTSGNTTDVASKYVKKYLDPKTFHRVKMRATPRYGCTLLDCIKFYPQFFIVAPDPHAYTTFSEVFIPPLRDACEGREKRGDLGGANEGGSSWGVHPPLVFQGSKSLLQNYPIVDLPSKFVQLVRTRVSRNIRPFPFIPIMKREDLYEVQRLVLKALGHEQYEWFDLEALEKDAREELAEGRGAWFPEATKISRFWPKGRGFLLNESDSTQIWVNAEDHVDVIVQSLYGKLGPLLEHVQSVMDLLAESFEFHYNSECGFLTVDPFRCGTALKITFRLRLPNLMQNRSYLTSRCDALRLTLRWKQKIRLFGSNAEISPDDWVEVENTRTCGSDENDIALELIESVNELIKDEEGKARAIDRATTKKKEHGDGK